MIQDIEKILFSTEELDACVSRIAGQIDKDYAGKTPIMIGILQGSFVFLADLVRKMELPIQVEFMSASSYGSGTESTGSVNIRLDSSVDLKGKDVILVEDILDSGNTLSRLVPLLKDRQVNSLEVCVLLDKPSRRVREVEVAYRGYSIPDAFVVGYGLDYDQKYRNLPYIGILKPEVYENDLD